MDLRYLAARLAQGETGLDKKGDQARGAALVDVCLFRESGKCVWRAHVDKHARHAASHFAAQRERMAITLVARGRRSVAFQAEVDAWKPDACVAIQIPVADAEAAQPLAHRGRKVGREQKRRLVRARGFGIGYWDL